MTDDTAQVKPEDLKVEDKPVVEPPLDANEIHSSSFDDILNQPVKEEPTIDAPVDKPAQAPVQEQQTQPVTPPLDTEKLKEEISESTAKRLLEQLAPADATAKEKKDLLADAPWKKENRQPSWEEALKYMADVNRTQVKEEILSELNAEAEAIEKQEREAQQARVAQETQTREAWNTYWNNQLSDLEAQGKIPKVANQADPNDPGKKARIGLFETMQKMAIEAQAQKRTPNLNLKEIYYEHYTSSQTPVAPATQQPAGADAPIAGAGKSVSNGKSDSFSYAEIHTKGFEDLLTGN